MLSHKCIIFSSSSLILFLFVTANSEIVLHVIQSRTILTLIFNHVRSTYKNNEFEDCKNGAINKNKEIEKAVYLAYQMNDTQQYQINTEGQTVASFPAQS